MVQMQGTESGGEFCRLQRTQGMLQMKMWVLKMSKLEVQSKKQENRIQNTKIRGKKCELNEESDNLKGLFEKELASYNNKKQCMKMNNKKYEGRLQDLIEEKEKEYKAEMKRLEEMQKELDLINWTKLRSTINTHLKRQDAKSNMNMLGITVRGTNINKLLLLPVDMFATILKSELCFSKFSKNSPASPGRKDLETSGNVLARTFTKILKSSLDIQEQNNQARKLLDQVQGVAAQIRDKAPKGSAVQQAANKVVHCNNNESDCPNTTNFHNCRDCCQT
ncbi:hypothetical protein PROFUN_13398 [Planoprotostelium fungivorum]|uniref:Uncharacterized protein n=1 Tax=Planoprotostelium fungivorum TaxID=1890364 RepID=A0A2P6N3M4_9EUKA|nr:hypothetical protein PROFUN_13398 [Planoprotostelium fungivorum]